MDSLTNKSLYAVFVINLILVGVLGIYAYKQLTDSKIATDMLYEHPFKVSNAVSSVHAHILSMHRHMKDVSLAEDKKTLDEAVLLVRTEENMVLDDFKIVFQNFLGDKSDVDKAFRKFLKWAEIRAQVIQLTREGRLKEAYSITKGRGAEHVSELESQIQSLSLFAVGKADKLHQEISKTQETGALILSLLIVTIILVGFIVFMKIISSQRLLRDTLSNHLHLIDQNIHIATLDAQGNIVEVTSALCRLVELKAEEVIGKTFKNILGKVDQNSLKLDDLFNTNLTGKEWVGELLRIDDEGEKAWVEVSSHPITDSLFNLTGIKMFFKDITHEKENELLAETDKLTSLLNRRNFENILKRQIRLARRNGLKLRFAILDIDYFKFYNDTYGHPEGDVVLKKIASNISKTYLRADDYIFRLGGEEFGILYSLSSESDEEENRAEVLKDKIESLQVPHSHNTVSPYLTVSIGTVAYTGNEIPSMDIIYRDADEALYDAKQIRNSVVNK